jgi:hypothetical protein
MNILIDKPSRTVTLLLLAVSFVAMLFVWFQFLPLEDVMTAAGDYGILDYELAFTPAKVAAIFDTWGPEARQAALQSLWIDFAFMPSYGLFFGLLTLIIARAHAQHWRTIGFWIVIGCFAAALLDALENIMLLIMLQAPSILTLPPLIAGIAASLKFALLLFAILYWFASLMRWGLLRLRHQH